MYRKKAKNKETGKTELIWLYYDESNREWSLFKDLCLKDKLDSSNYIIDFEDNNKMPFELFGIECGKGWYPLLKPVINYIDEYNSNENNQDKIYINQIKEKFGTLNIYVSHGTQELFKLIDEAENKSQYTCEYCGTEDNVGTIVTGYIMTLCHDCCKKWIKNAGMDSDKWLKQSDNNIYRVFGDTDKKDELISSQEEYENKLP